MKIITQDIKAHSFKPVYLLSGEETYLTRQFCKQLSEAIAGDDEMNVTRYSEKDPDIKEIISFADTIPFFAEARLIVIENSGFFKKDVGELTDYLKEMPETTHIIFCETEVDKRQRLYKEVKKLGHCAEMNAQDTKTLITWGASLLSRYGIRVRQSDMEYLLENTGTDMNLIKNELDKLASYVGDRDILTREDIDALCVRQLQDRIFDMIEAMSTGNRQRAFALYEDLVALKEPPIKILVLITRQYIQLLTVAEMQAMRKNYAEIATELGLPQFVAKKLCNQVRNFTPARLKWSVEQCAQMDADIKSGKIKDSMAVELLITAFSMQ